MHHSFLLYRGGVIEQPRLSSGNFLRATFWSDGKVEAPMFKKYPPFGACPHCDQTVWLADLKTIGVDELRTKPLTVELHEGATLKLPPVQIEASVYKRLSFERMIDYTRHTKSIRRHVVARTLAWQTGNDPRREKTSLPLLNKEVTNLRRLIKLLDPRDENERLFTGEANRELRRFAQTLDLLQDEMSESCEQVRNLILDFALSEDSRLFKFPAKQ